MERTAPVMAVILPSGPESRGARAKGKSAPCYRYLQGIWADVPGDGPAVRVAYNRADTGCVDGGLTVGGLIRRPIKRSMFTYRGVIGRAAGRDCGDGRARHNAAPAGLSDRVAEVQLGPPTRKVGQMGVVLRKCRSRVTNARHVPGRYNG